MLCIQKQTFIAPNNFQQIVPCFWKPPPLLLMSISLTKDWALYFYFVVWGQLGRWRCQQKVFHSSRIHILCCCYPCTSNRIAIVSSSNGRRFTHAEGKTLSLFLLSLLATLFLRRFRILGIVCSNAWRTLACPWKSACCRQSQGLTAKRIAIAAIICSIPTKSINYMPNEPCRMITVEADFTAGKSGSTCQVWSQSSRFDLWPHFGWNGKSSSRWSAIILLLLV